MSCSDKANNGSCTSVLMRSYRAYWPAGLRCEMRAKLFVIRTKIPRRSVDFNGGGIIAMKKKGMGKNLFPTQGRSTENGGFRTFEGRNEEFRLDLENLQHVFIVSLAQGLHEVVAGFGQTTEENKGLG